MITNDTKLKVIQLKQSGMTYSQISEQLGISKGSISTIVKEAGLGVSKPVEITEELLEHWTVNPRVVSSNLTPPST